MHDITIVALSLPSEQRLSPDQLKAISIATGTMLVESRSGPHLGPGPGLVIYGAGAGACPPTARDCCCRVPSARILVSNYVLPHSMVPVNRHRSHAPRAVDQATLLSVHTYNLVLQNPSRPSKGLWARSKATTPCIWLSAWIQPTTGGSTALQPCACSQCQASQTLVHQYPTWGTQPSSLGSDGS